MLKDRAWAPQEGVKDAPSPSFSHSSIQMPKILQTLYTYMEKSPHRPFSFHAVFFLTCSHREPAISCLLQKGLPMDGYVHYPPPSL